jgi:hypothetical protein
VPTFDQNQGGDPAGDYKISGVQLEPHTLLICLHECAITEPDRICSDTAPEPDRLFQSRNVTERGPHRLWNDHNGGRGGGAGGEGGARGGRRRWLDSERAWEVARRRRVNKLKRVRKYFESH